MANQADVPYFNETKEMERLPNIPVLLQDNQTGLNRYNSLRNVEKVYVNLLAAINISPIASGNLARKCTTTGLLKGAVSYETAKLRQYMTQNCINLLHAMVSLFSFVFFMIETHFFISFYLFLIAARMAASCAAIN